MLVRDIMTRDVMTIDMDASIEEVARVFAMEPFHHLVVVDHGIVVGVLSDRDKLKHLSPFIGKMAERPQDVASLKRRVHQIMTRRPVTASEDEPAWRACEKMLRGGISCLPVVSDAGLLLGIVTVRDFARVGGELLRERYAA